MLMTAERVETMQRTHPQQAERYVTAILDRARKATLEIQYPAPSLMQKAESQRLQM